MRWLLLAPLLFSTLYALLAFWQVLRFRNAHRSHARWNGDPPVCVLRPLHGADERSYENLASLCRQPVVPTAIRYGVDSQEDKAAPLARRLQEDFPGIPSRLLTGSTRTSPNRKITNLVRLACDVTEPLVLAMDQDIEVPPDHFEEVLGHFDDPRTGLVTTLYRLASPVTLGSALELLALHADFFPSVLVGEKLEGGLSFAFGATLAVRREVLERVGGFQGLADYLADDYELGHRVWKAGYRVALSASIPVHHPGPLSFRGFWERQIRAVRTHRVCRPGGYALSLLTHGVPWLILLFSLFGFSSWAFWAAAGWTLSRLALVVASHAVLTRMQGSWWPLLLVPLHECLRLFFWLLAFLGNRVRWGEAVFRVFPDGRMSEEFPGRTQGQVPERRKAL